MTDATEFPSPLSHLSDDEQLLRTNVQEFAKVEIAPLVQEMDKEARIPRALIDKLVDLGVMAIEIPETFGGVGGHFGGSMDAPSPLGFLHLLPSFFACDEAFAK